MTHLDCGADGCEPRRMWSASQHFLCFTFCCCVNLLLLSALRAPTNTPAVFWRLRPVKCGLPCWTGLLWFTLSVWASGPERQRSLLALFSFSSCIIYAGRTTSKLGNSDWWDWWASEQVKKRVFKCNFALHNIDLGSQSSMQTFTCSCSANFSRPGPGSSMWADGM